MLHPTIDCPAFGPEIHCPHCHRIIPALFLTDTYLCSRHGAFEVSTTGELVHVLSGRCWHQWKGTWYRQHIHIDGLRFEIGEALDQLHHQGRRATQITIAQRYQVLFEGGPNRASTAPKRLYNYLAFRKAHPPTLTEHQPLPSGSTLWGKSCLACP